MRFFLLVDDCNKDSVAECAAALKRPPVELLTLSEILNRCDVIYDSDKAAFDLTKMRIPEDIKQSVIINRLVEISDITLRSLDKGTNTVDRNMVNGVLHQLLIKLEHVVGSPGLYSSVGHSLPLHLQWRWVDEMIPELTTPVFKYSIGNEVVDTTDIKNPIWKSPFELFDWSSSSADPETQWNKFVVDKPEGEPIVFYFIGDVYSGLLLKSQKVISKDTASASANWVHDIRSLFNASAGEILVMAKSSQAVFLAFSHALNTGADAPDFQATVSKGLLELTAS